jgi:hypothetical protein
MNKRIIKRQAGFWFRFSSLLMLQGILTLTLMGPFPARAVDIQALPLETVSKGDFTHAAVVTWDDLNAADASAVVLQLFAIPTNSYIDKVGWYVEEAFTNATYATGVDAGSNLVVTVGVGGTTNAFFGSNTIIAARAHLSTNMLVPYRATTSTNQLIACFSDGLQATQVDNYLVGKIRIYFRVVQLSKLRL